MKITYSELAILDLKIIADYLIEEANIDIALKVTDEIYRVIIEVISNNPKVGSKINYFTKAELCQFPTGKYPYNIYYVLRSDQLLIVRVLHGKRDIRSILSSS